VKYLRRTFARFCVERAVRAGHTFVGRVYKSIGLKFFLGGSMNAGYRYISFLFLTAALSAPAALITRAASQDEHRDEHHDQKRVYDRAHKDYHNWDDNEDHYYHQYYTENHREYRDYSKLNRKDQDNYWKWRHEHEEHH
jgi:hypothetical protein